MAGTVLSTLRCCRVVVFRLNDRRSLACVARRVRSRTPTECGSVGAVARLSWRCAPRAGPRFLLATGSVGTVGRPSQAPPMPPPARRPPWRGATASFAPSASGQAQSPTGLITELRQVSVLFCDLVGFTPLAESKDPEEVRELLSGVLRARPRHRDSLRRRRREVHRRCSHGGLGGSDRQGGRRGAGRSRRARSRLRPSPRTAPNVARSRSAPGWASSPEGRHDRDPRGGLCRRRPGQHGGEDPIGRPTGLLLCRRVDHASPPTPPSPTRTPADTS